MSKQPSRHDKLLFTPGPLTTSLAVKEAMLHDMGSRDPAFIAIVRRVRERLLAVSGLSPTTHSAVLLQGSGSMIVEAVIASALPRDGKLMVFANGAYGHRMAATAKILGIECSLVAIEENEAVSPEVVEKALAADPQVTHVGVIHSETTSGIINPIVAVGEVVHRHGCSFIVDAMSSFGGVDEDYRAAHVDWLASSANKCLESVPGLAYVLASREALDKARDNVRSLCFDLAAQYAGLEKDGQFRFTPPVQVVLALDAALEAFEAEGGVRAREERYKSNSRILRKGMANLGFREYLPGALQGWIISSFYYPEEATFSFPRFYDALSRRGCIIYPGKVSKADLFRIGTIGNLYEEDIRRLLAAIAEVLEEMDLHLSPLPEPV